MAARRITPAGTPQPAAASLPTAAPPSPASPGMVVSRARLHALLDARLPGAVWLHGPTGAGKTVLLRSHLHRDRGPSLWLTVDERHRDPAALFTAIGALAAPLCDGALPAFSPEHRDDPAAFAHDYFVRLDRALPSPVSLVFDDVHHLVGTTAPLLAGAIDAFGARRALCFASQLKPDASFAPHLAGSRLWIVGHRSLAFEEGEARELAERLGASTPALAALVDATDGWAAGLMLAMQFGAGGDGNPEDPLETVRTPLALLIAGQVLGGATSDDLARLRLLAELPQVPMELSDQAPDWAGACARLQALSERGLFVERLVADPATASDGPAPGASRPSGGTNVKRLFHGCWRLHDLFRSALRETTPWSRAAEGLGEPLIDHLLALDRLDLGWQLAARLGPTVLDAVVRAHGDAALRGTNVPVLLQMTAPHAGREAPAVAVWFARGQIGRDHTAALAACDAAWQGFRDGNDDAGGSVASALALFVVFATIENVGEMAVWASRFDEAAPVSLDPTDDTEAQALRIAGTVVHDLLIGSRTAAGAEPTVLQDRLMAIVGAETLSADETILAGSLLVAAMRRAMRGPEVELAVLRVEALASYRRSAPHIRANWKIENGYHFTRLGAPAAAMRCFGDAIEVADHNALLQPRVGALIGLVRLALGVGDTRRARELLDELDAVGADRLGRQHGWVLHLRARFEALTGRPSASLDWIDRAERLIAEAGFPRSTNVILDQDRIQMLYAAGRVDESVALAGRVSSGNSAVDARRVGILAGLLDAHARWQDDRPRAEVLLEQHLRAAEALDLTTFLYLLPGVASQIAGWALDRDLAVDFLCRAIRVRNLAAPLDPPARWPWPVRVELLRAFRIVRDGEPLAFSGKAQQKPLELLKFLACQRDFVADPGALAGALWPDADEAPARKSLEVTVSRLRKLLDDDALVVVKEGKVALDARRVSSDAKEFLQVATLAESVAGGRLSAPDVTAIGERLLHLFVELPLEHEDATAWREAVRERYKATFVRSVRALVGYWTAAGLAPRATSLIEAALAREPLAEALYRQLMQIHLDASNPVEAMRVYRQCRQMLSVLIGAPPSAETERLKNLIPL